MENNSKHTPGPWSLERAESNRVMHFDDDSQTHYRHVAYCGSDWDTGRTGERDKEDTANARLIASAPDLLAALKALHAAIDIPGAAKPTAAERAAWSLAGDAIAKAEGK